MKSFEIDQTIRRLERKWKDTRKILDQEEKALVETYLGLLQNIAKSCIENGCRVWFRPNQVVHWGEGGFGHLSIFIPGRRKANSFCDLPGEVEFITKASNKRSLGEEITSATLDRITYTSDHWL
ncbi:MAG: hypothetical protein ACREQ2_06775 [Candidatus Binatia bacterium]